MHVTLNSPTFQRDLTNVVGGGGGYVQPIQAMRAHGVVGNDLRCCSPQWDSKVKTTPSLVAHLIKSNLKSQELADAAPWEEKVYGIETNKNRKKI